MARRLDDFTITIHMPGWFIQGYGSCRKGQVFKGEAIHPRMVDSVANDEKFVENGVYRRSICELNGGTVEELRKALKTIEPQKKEPVVHTEHTVGALIEPKPVVEDVEVNIKPKVKPEAEPEPKVKKQKEDPAADKTRKPRRKPRKTNE